MPNSHNVTDYCIAKIQCGTLCEAARLCFSVLQPVRKPAIKVNWSELRKVPCKQRGEMKLKLQQDSNIAVSSNYSKELRWILYKCYILIINNNTN
jgi:hypothetical protein